MTAAVAAAFPSSDGGTIVVSVGPNGCNVSKNQRHIGCVVDGVFVLDVPEPLPPVDVQIVRIAAVRVRRLAEDMDRTVALPWDEVLEILLVEAKRMEGSGVKVWLFEPHARGGVR